MSDTIPENPPLKQCTKCKESFPATSDFFSRDSRTKDGLQRFCKECINAYHRSHRINGPQPKEVLPPGYKRCNKCQKLLPATSEYFSRDKYKPDGFVSSCKEHGKRVRKGSIVDGIKKCTQCGQEYPATLEYFFARWDRKSGLTSKCKKCVHAREIQRQRPKASKETNRQRYLTERDRRLQQRSVYYREHVEEYRLYYQQYRQTHPEQMKANGHNRRARKRAAPGRHTAIDIRRQYESQKGKCYYCSAKLGKGKGAYHVDHIVPLSRGGSNDPSNLVIACPTCNLNKKDKLLHEWPKGGRLF